MGKRKSDTGAKQAVTTDGQESFVVLLDECHESEPVQHPSNMAKSQANDGVNSEKGSFVVMLDDEPESSIEASQASPEGSFVVLLDDEDQASINAAKDDYFVVLLDDESDDTECVERLSDGVFGVSLPSDFRIQKVVALKPDLVATLGAREVKYDASRVALADTASIQVVAAHLAALETADVDVIWTGASEVFLNTARILGFDFCAPTPVTDEDKAAAA